MSSRRLPGGQSAGGRGATTDQGTEAQQAGDPAKEEAKFLVEPSYPATTSSAQRNSRGEVADTS